jgi:methylenetetrahydrofolate reductase (NADPH)
MNIVAKPAQFHRVDEVRAIADFVRGYSIEATRPTTEEIAALARVAPKSTRVYVSTVPGRPLQDVVECAVRLRRSGFEPVPHIAARSFVNRRAADEHLALLTGEAGVRRALVIAGDTDPPAGKLRSAIELIDGGLLQRRGIVEIGIAGYPDGHPRIPTQELTRALAEKVAAAEQTGLAAHIVTQFCFDAAAIRDWIRRLRDFGCEGPVRIGLAGPTSITALTRFARRCGVRMSVQGLLRHTGLLRNLFSMSAPDTIIRALAEEFRCGGLDDAQLHFFSFGGLAGTARWAAAVEQGRIALQAGQGFGVEPAS